MDKKKGLLNAAVSIAFKIIILIANILVRRFLIVYIGNAINGLNSLYVSILDFFSVAELGVGTAITFCMYKPVVEGDNDKVSALYGLFTKLYFAIGGIVLVAGCALMPALPYIAKDYLGINVNLYLTFALMLVSVVLSYGFSSKTSLINAYKNNYITTTVNSLGQILQLGLQATVLIFTHSFAWFLACRVFATVLQWAATEIIARKRYNQIIANKQKVDDGTKKEIVKNVKAMFMHKIGGVLVNTVDSIIISAFIGIVILGKYSNYTIIVTAMVSVLSLFFTPLTSVIGHMVVEEGKESARKYCRFFHTLNFILGIVFFLGYYAVIDNLVAILFGKDLELSRAIAMVITVDYFVQFMRQTVLLFRDATGTFYNDRWKPLIEGLINIGLSILFVCVFPKDYRVVGVIVATIVTNLFICHVVEPYVLYRHAFGTSVKKYYLRNYLYIIVFVGAMFAMHFCMQHFESQWLELLVNGCISLAFSIPICVMVSLSNKDFRHHFLRLLEKLKRKKAVAVPIGEETDADDATPKPEPAPDEKQELNMDNENFQN